MSYSSVVWIDDPFFIKRQRVQMACSFCRQRKIRCDGRNPCANCKKYATACTYVKIERQPRKPSRNGNDNENNDNNNGGSSSGSGNNQSSSQSTNSNSLNVSSQQTGTSTRQSSNSGRGKRPIEEVEQLPPNLPPSRRSAPSTQGIFNPNPTMTTTPQSANWQSNSISVAKPEPKLPLIDNPVMPNNDVIEHLLALYWVNVHPYVPVLNKNLFLQQRENANDPPSPLLLNAMFAVSAEFSERPSVRSDPETHETGGWIYFDRARALLDDFMDAPRMSTIAALILMSIYQQHNTRRSGISPGYFRRWMYIGMANRMALELELNKDCEDPLLDNSHKNLRKRLWWSLFMVDVLVCCGIGKASNIEEDECTIPEPDIDIDEPELKSNGAINEFVHQVRFTRMLHLLLKHNFSSKLSASPYNQDNIVANFEEQIHTWAFHLPLQSTDTLIGNSNKFSTQSTHLHMLYHSFIILLHRRYIANFESLLKCTQAAAQVTPIGEKILRTASTPFRGFLNCTTWCLLQAGMIHALNKFRGNEETSQVAEQHYDKIVVLFQRYSQFTALHVLQDHANTCSSHRLSMMDYWSSPENGQQQQQQHHQHHHQQTHDSMFTLSNLGAGSKNLSYGTTLHMSPGTAANNGFLTQINTPFPSPPHGTVSPLCQTPNESPNVDLGQFTNITSPLIDSEGTPVHSPNHYVDYNPFPVLGKDQGSGCAELLNNDEDGWPFSGHEATTTSAWQHKHYSNNTTHLENENYQPHPATPSASPVDVFGISTPTIHASPTTSPFHSPTQQDVDGGIESNTISNDSTPSIGNTTPPGGYSQSAYNSSPISSNRHESESSCGTGYVVSGFSGEEYSPM
ncbi:fungal-specific transcription factor domain-containing protein [Rhizophagus irregularis DAOM 181602=DAOM 197198]|nr:fungal-specific transcription factor domain-containing protein [Rhizophagus irregularis DAOM 181602=DAOM 197198]